MENSFEKGKTSAIDELSQHGGCVNLGGFGMKGRRQRRNGVTKTNDGGKCLFDNLLLEAEKRALKSSNGSTDGRNCALRRFERAVVHSGLRIRYDFYGLCDSSKEVRGEAELEEASNASSSPSSDTEHDGASPIQPSVDSRIPERNAAALALSNIRTGLRMSAVGPKTLAAPVIASKKRIHRKKLQVSPSAQVPTAADTDDVIGAIANSTAQLRLDETNESKKVKQVSERGVNSPVVPEAVPDFQAPRKNPRSLKDMRTSKK